MRTFILISALLLTSSAFGATGSTSTWATSTGVVIPEIVSSPTTGGGWPIRAYNYTTSQYEMLPQCFPWTLYTLFLIGDISAIYKNQEICRLNRALDFRI